MFCGNLGVGVGVDFSEDYLVVVGFSKFFDDWGELFVWGILVGLVVDEDWFGGIENFGSEGCISDFDDVVYDSFFKMIR